MQALAADRKSVSERLQRETVHLREKVLLAICRDKHQNLFANETTHCAKLAPCLEPNYELMADRIAAHVGLLQNDE